MSAEQTDERTTGGEPTEDGTSTGGGPGEGMSSDAEHTPDEISVAELRTWLDEGRAAVLVDVRKPFERDIADLPEVGQRRIPLQELPERTDELDPDETLVLYCRSGGRSERAAQWLRLQGFEKVINLRGGVMAWREEVDSSLEAY